MNPFGDTPVGEGINPFGDRPISTITGKPIPTSEEKIKQTGDVWKTAGPIAGDIALTMAAPQLKGAKMGIKAINLLMRSLASGAGSFGGSVAGQKMAGDEVDYEEAKKQGLLGLTGEPVLTGAGAVLKMAGKPIKYAGEYLARPLKPGLEAVQKSAIKKEVKAAEDLLVDLAPGVVKKQKVPIDDLDLKVAKSMDEIGLAYDKYEGALKTFAEKNNGVVNMKGTQQYLSGLIKEQNPNTALFQHLGLNRIQRNELSTILQKGEANPEVIKRLLSDKQNRIFAKYNKLTTKQKEMREALKETFLNDLEQSGAKGLRQDADLMFKQVKRFEMVKNLFKPSMGVTKEGKQYIYPYNIAKKIYMNEKKLLDPKTGVPELWPKLKEIADHYIETYKPLQKIEATDNFPIEKAWGLMPKWIQKSLSALSGVGKKTAKATGKAAIHLGGEEVNF